MRSEKTISSEIAKGKHAAFAELYNRYAQDLFNYAFKLLTNDAEAKEAVQQVFIKLWEQRRRLDGMDKLKPYLYRAVYNTCLNIIRHRKVVEKSAGQLALDALFLELEDPEHEAELSGKLRSGIAQLPEKNKEVVNLRFFSGLSTKEVSEQLGISPRTVETHVSKALKLLRNLLNPSILIFFHFFS